ncbi:hypothetical protein NLJ89_g8832 [Agrocybe chaxingu]|uniref:Cryptic loci regulator 2 N-terminal domain-containing protein n=1 Tax=Agrocybe chaxingu TaxID=84603 RepID=A0A9W8K144_9AGAR|nr:hypothetical protein NLJ89_g8832 [Agrocybe chaxingu]
MSRRVAADGYSLPANPHYLDFPRTDGSKTTWPSVITREVDAEGHVNYYECLGEDHSQHIRWRTMVGDAVAKKLGMPEGPNYVLRSFPEEYRLYDHNKGPAKSPRHDLYLFGPFKKRFRSVFEFVPHAIWLMDGSSGCICKYCSKTAQREITSSMSTSGIIRATPVGQSPAPSRVKSIRDKGKGREPLSRPKPRDTKTYATVQRIAKPSIVSEGVLRTPMLVERNNDLRAIYSKTSMDLRRWFREGEVVWCALEAPITGPQQDAACIRFWPAVVDEVKLKTEPIPRRAANGHARSGSSQSHLPQAGSSAMQVDPSSSSIGTEKGPMLERAEEPLPWTIRQSTQYKVQLLAVSHCYTIPDDQVLPYQAYMPSDDLIRLMLTYPPDRLTLDKESLSSFNPYTGPTPPTLFEAVPPYALALQIASTLSSFWCLTDEYELNYTLPHENPKRPPLPSRAPLPSRIPPPSISTPSMMPPPLMAPSQFASSSQMPPPATFQQALEMANEHPESISSGPSNAFYRNVYGVDPSMSQAAVQKTTEHVLGAPPPPDNLVQKRFQGLWWGAERIWTDDFIRLKVPRRTLAPQGNGQILPPSGPSKSVAEEWIGQGGSLAEMGAGSRGVFLRLDGIFAVEVPQENGSSTKEARVCGMLYELADEDWEDPNTSAPSAPSHQANEDSADPASSSQVPPSVSAAVIGGLSGTPGGIVPNGAGVNGSLSKDAFQYTLPQAPVGYKFRAILNPGYEFVGALGLISGRYYPRILAHPKLLPIVKEALSHEPGEGAIIGSDNLWALEGLSGGYFNSVDPHRYKRTRVAMMQDADREAVQQLQTYAQGKMEEAAMAQNSDGGGDDVHVLEGEHDAMDVDADDIYA